MKTILCSLAAAALLTAKAAAAGVEAGPLAIQRLGTRVVAKPGQEPTSVELFMLTLGDTSTEDRKFGQRDSHLLPFSMDSTQYAPDGAGAWRLYQFRMPDLTGDAGSEAFLEFLRRPDVKRQLEAVYTHEDFGGPGDFIYKRMNVPASELPAPFNRLPAADREAIKCFYQYNADGTMNILLAEPFDEDAAAHKLFERWKRDIAASPRGG